MPEKLLRTTKLDIVTETYRGPTQGLTIVDITDNPARAEAMSFLKLYLLLKGHGHDSDRSLEHRNGIEE